MLTNDGAGASPDDICKDCDQLRKLSICVKALQHKWKILKPISFTLNPNESNCQCLTRRFYGKNNKIDNQKMYLCPATTIKFRGFDNIVRSSIQPSFLIGQGSHRTHYRVRIFNRADPASVEGQLTGFLLNGLRFVLNSRGHYKYIPVYERSDDVELVCVVVPREARNTANYRLERADSSSSDSDTVGQTRRYNQ